MKEKTPIDSKKLLEQISQFLRANMPDKDTCESWVGRLKNTKDGGALIYREDHTMVWAFYYFWYACFHSGRGGLDYATFSQDHLGKKIGRSRWGVARAIKGLARQGFLRSYRRKHKSSGKWQTNRYLIGVRAWYFVLNWLKSHYPVFFRKKSNPFLQKPCSTSAPQEPQEVGSIRVWESSGEESRDSSRGAVDPCQDLPGPVTNSGIGSNGHGDFMECDDFPVQDLNQFRNNLRESTPVLPDTTENSSIPIKTKGDDMSVEELEIHKKRGEWEKERVEWEKAVAQERKEVREGNNEREGRSSSVQLPPKTQFESTFDGITVEKMREEVVRLHRVMQQKQREGKNGGRHFYDWKNMQIVFNNRCEREGRKDLRFDVL